MKNRSVLLTVAVAVLGACSGGDPVATTTGTDTTAGCSGNCGSTSATNLTTTDVQQVIAQAVAEAQARGVSATVAVVDRVGNVLAVYRTGAAAARSVTITTSPAGATVSGGLEGIRLPVAAAPVNIDHAAAIAKAITGAYLSSEGNAFSTRTASQIVQEHFNPREQFQPSGPLFGVQFSQLACSDLMREFDGVGPGAGPQRSPLGLSADPGGFPLYKSGTVVGGVGVLADGVYTIDKDIADSDADVDEAIAYAGTFGFAAPVDRRGDRITADGKTLRFSDVDFNQLRASPASAPAFSTLAVGVGALISVPGYFDGVVRAGTSFGQPASGIRADDLDYSGRDAFVLVDAANVPRYPPRAGTDGALLGGAVLTQNEVRTVLQLALDVANRARAQIRRPTGSQARVTISVVDTQGEILGIARTRDAPVFGIDVSLQKARTAAFMSSSTAGAFLAALPDAKYLSTTDASVGVSRQIAIGGYVTALRSFLNDGNALADGRIAYSDRAAGNLSRPFFPDGIDSEGAGPLSKAAGEWSPFSTGLQLDVTINAVLQHVLFVAGVPGVPDVAPGCAGVALANDLSSVGQTIAGVRLGNGLQIFPGSVPIYRGGTLIGAIGVSGDGVDQDDMIAFLGLHLAGEFLAGAINNAPKDRRADTVIAQGVRLRYVQCPQSPFLNSSDDNVCEGK
ncbi:MAG TPA: heme-binding protein [Steroidobacteraceae bacterium]|nr:heme-binding protein [Steroidobacteraceae bacterium]